MDITLDLPVFTVAVSGGIAALVYYIDRRRARLTDMGHRRAIGRSMEDLNGMVAQVMLDVGDLDVHESDETIPERLSQYLARNYKRAEFLISTIDVHGAACTTLSDQEKKDIDTTVRFVRWLLDSYYPQDVREETRHKVWTRHPPDKLKKRAREMHVCVCRFTRAPAPS